MNDKNQVKLVIFDLDGTVLDTLSDLTAAMAYALSCSGFPPRSLADVRRFVGNGYRKLVERSLPPDLPEETVGRVFADFQTYYAAHCADSTRPYDGIPEVLLALRSAGVKTAVLSNKGNAAVQALCDRYFKGLFDCAVGERPGIPRKPAPDAVFEILSRFGVRKGEAVYIGDSDVDVETAANAGLRGVFVSYGFRSRDELSRAGAGIIVGRPGELLPVLLPEEK